MAQNSGQGITIYDVAKKANVSISTVSRVFNNSPLVSSKTRKKVQKVIDEMGFVPSSIARSLVSASSKTIGLIVSDITNPFFADTIDGIESVLHSEGFSVFLCDTRYNREREANYINQMLEKRVDGIIIFSADMRHELLTGIKTNFIVSISQPSKWTALTPRTRKEPMRHRLPYKIRSQEDRFPVLRL